MELFCFFFVRLMTSKSMRNPKIKNYGLSFFVGSQKA